MPKASSINIQVVTGDSRPIFKQIVDAIRLRVAQGQLKRGDKLPSVRGLAMQLTVNANTVAKAYASLTAQGVVESHQGLGLFVAQQRQVLSDIEREKRLQTAIDLFVNDIALLEFSKREILTRLGKSLAGIKPTVAEQANKNQEREGKHG